LTPAAVQFTESLAVTKYSSDEVK